MIINHVDQAKSGSNFQLYWNIQTLSASSFYWHSNLRNLDN